MRKLIIGLILSVTLVSCSLCYAVAGSAESNKESNLSCEIPSLLRVDFGNPIEEFKEAKIVMDQAIEDARLKEEERLRQIEQQKQSILNIAKSLVGRGGNCWYIANLFIKKYTGHYINSYYCVDEPQPGDLIYYRNGGLGCQHWAIYLGDDKALQGNFNGKAKITSVYLKNASSPIYYRVN